MSLVVTLLIVVGFAPLASTQAGSGYYYNRDDYRPVVAQGVRLGFGDDQYRQNPGGTLRRQYTSGEPFDDVFVSIYDVGIQAPLEDTKLTITLPKVDYVDTNPQLPTIADAQRLETREDTNAFYADYYFDRINPGADIRIPLDFKFRNEVTIPGATYVPTVELFVGGQSIATNNVTFWAHTVTNFDVYYRITDGINYHIWGREVEEPVHRFFVEDLETQGWRTPEEGVTITYEVGGRIRQPYDRTRGIVHTDAYKVVVQLEEFVEVHPDSLAAGWVHDSGANTLTYTADNNTTACGTFTDEEGVHCKELKLLYRHAPVSTDNTWDGPRRFYSPRIATTYFQGGKEVETNERYLSPIGFVAEEIPVFKGRTHDLTLEKTAPRPDQSKNTFASYSAIVSEDNLWSGETNLGPGGTDPIGLTWQALLRQTNNGSALAPVAEGGLKDNIHRIIEKDLDPRMYFHQVWLEAGPGGLQPAASLSWPQVEERINATSNIVWGVTESGEKVELARDIDLSQKVSVNDTTRRFDRLEVEFTTPLVMDNFDLEFKTSAFPLPEDRARWERQEYGAQQDYPSTTVVEYVTDEQTDTSTKEGTAKQRIFPPIRYLNITGLDNWWTVYDTVCRADTVPDLGKGDDPFCSRHITTGIESTPEKYDQTWGQYRRPLGDLKHVYLLPDGVTYRGLEWARSGNQDKTAQPDVEIVKNFHDTGLTGVVLSFGDVDHGRGDYNAGAGSMIRLFVEPSANQGRHEIKKYVLWDNNDVITARVGKIPDTDDLDRDNNTTEFFLSDNATVTYHKDSALTVTKKVAIGDGPFTSGPVHQEIGGKVRYEVTVANTSGYRSGFTITDIFPSTHDASQDAQGELRPRQWMHNGELKTHSGFNVQLTGPISNILSHSDVEERDITDLILVEYGVATPDPSSPNGVGYRWDYVSADQISDWGTVSAVRLTAPDDFTLYPNDNWTFTTTHVVKSDEAQLPAGTKAVNTATYSDRYDFVESPAVVVEIANYQVDGVAFEDVDADGVRSLNEPLIASVPFTVVDAKTGGPVRNAQGAEIIGVTNDQGGYSVQIPQGGEYRIRFEKQPGQQFAATGVGAKANHVAVCAESADNFAGSGGVAGFIARTTGLGNAGATDDNCASRRAAVHNFGWTSAFVLNPTNVAETRNVGLTALQGMVTVLKKDQDGAPVPDAEFTLTWKEATGSTPDSLPVTVTGKTGDNGELRLGPVPFGVYTLTETKVPAGYQGAADPVEVTVAPGAVPVEVINQRIDGQVVVRKLDQDSREPIQGAQFELRGEQGIVVGSAQTTNEQGVATFSGVRPGTYHVVETAPAAGYAAPAEPSQEVIVPAEGGAVTLEITNAAIRGTVTLNKVAAGSGNPVLGATFELRAGDRVVDTQTSGEDGVVTFTGVLAGRYRVVEKEPAAGFHRGQVALDAEITTEGQVVNLGRVENQPHRGQIEFMKVSGTGGPALAGATFELRSGDRVVATATSSNNGLVRFENLVHGRYQIVETQAPAGHILNDTAINVEVTNDELVRLPAVSNEPITGNVLLFKTELPTHKPLAGAVFSLRTPEGVEVDSQTTGQDGRLRFEKVRPGKYHVVESVAPEGYQLLEYPLVFEMGDQGEDVNLGEVSNIKAVGTVQLTKVDAVTGQPIEGAWFEMYREGEWFARVPSNHEGLVKFRRVFNGDYTIVEVEPAPGYALSDRRFEVQITENGQVVDLGKVENTPLVGSLEFTKVDAVTLSPILGAEFGLFHGDELRYRAESNADGVVRFSDIPYGTYTLKETQAPAGYVYDPQEREVTISEGSRSVFGEVLNVPYVSTVHLRKVDAVSRQPLAGAEFGLFNDRAEEVARATTRQDGQVAFPQVRPGFYTLVELEAPVGYQRVPEPIEVLVPAHGQAVDLGDVTNAPITGDVVLTKVDGTTGEPLPGTHFELRQGHNTIAQAVTDQWGMLRFETIPFGSYTLVETQPAPGFVATTDQWTVTIAEPDQVVNLGVVENQPVTGSIELTKVDAVTKTPLAGAVFALKDGEQELARATSTEEGLVHFDTARAGQYTVVELSAPAGYQVRTEPIPVTVAGDGQTVRVGTVENHPIIGGIRLRKVDAVDPTITLPGVTFALLAANGAIVQEQVTGTDGSLTFENVPFGTYQVVETKATEGYVLADQRMQVTVTEHGKILDLGPVGNTRIVGEVALTKLEAGTARALAGVGFELRTPGGAVVAAGTTDQQGSLTFPGVSYGSYELVETAALPGFQALSKPIPVSVLEHGKTVHVGQVPNERIRGDITIKAVDKETKKPLAGATFELVGEGGTVAEATSNGEGIVRFNSHLWGNYALVETREPAGYLPTNTRIPVAIHTHGEVVDAGVVEYSRPPAPSVNPPGPGGLWKIFIPFLFLVGIDGNGSSNPQPGTYHQVPQPPAEQPVGAPAAPAEQPEAQVTTLAVTGSEVLPLVGVALLLMLAGAVILRRRS